MNPAKRVLIFEDDPISASFLQAILLRHQYTILKIEDEASQAVELCRDLKPGLVLMDIHLSGERSGIDAAEAIHKTFGIPLIFITGETNPETFEEARKANPVSFIVKPYTERQLIALLELAEQNSRLKQAVNDQNYFFSALFNASNDGIILIDQATGGLLDMNPAASLLTGVSAGEGIGQTYQKITGIPLPDAFLSEKNDLLRHLLFRTLENGETQVLQVEKRSCFNTGSRLVIQWRLEDLSLRYKTETRLQLISEALEQSNDAVIITESNLDEPGPTIVFVNSVFSRMTGYSSEEALGKSPRFLQGPESNRKVIKELKKQLRAGQPFTGITTNYRKDGSTYKIEWTISPIRNEQNEITHFVSVQRDITEKLAQERKLLESESTLRNILESSLQAYFLIDTDAEILAFNKVGAAFFDEIFRVTPVLHTNFLAYLPELDAKRFQVHFERAKAGEKSFAERILENRMGIEHWFRLAFGPVYDDAQNLMGVSVTAEEITAEKRANEEKELLLKRLQGTLNASTDGVIMIDSYGSIIDVNQSSEQLFGTTKDEFADLDFWQIFPNTNFQVGDRRTVQHITTHDSSPLVEEVDAKRPDGSMFDAEISISTYEIEGRLYHTVFVRDISVRKQAAQALAKERDLLDLIFKTAFAPIMLVNRNMDVLFANPRAIDYFQLEWNSARSIYQFPAMQLFTEKGVPTDIKSATFIPDDAKTLPMTRLTVAWEGAESKHFFITGAALDAETRVISTLDVTKNTEYLLALQESEIRFRSMADSAPMIIWMTDKENKIQYINRTGYAFLGIPETEDPANLHTTAHPDDDVLYKVLYDQAAESRTAFSVEYRLRHSSGNYRWVADYGSPRISADGSYQGFIGCTIDIHNEKTIRKQNTELAERVKNITRHIPGFIYQMKADAAGKLSFPFTSDGFERIFGFPGSAVTQDATPVLALIDADDRKTMFEEFEAFKRNPIPHTREFRIHLNGVVRWLESSATPDVFTDGSVVWNGYISDITERKIAEEALRENEERFHAMFDKHGAVMMLIEPDTGRILDANDAAAKFYGYSTDQLMSMNISDINTLTKEEVQKLRLEAKIEHQNYFNFPHRLANGEIREVEVHSSPISIGGAPILFSIVHDITARKKVEAELKRQRELLQTLIDNIPDTIYVKDKNFRKILVNKAELKYSGFDTIEEVLGKDDEDIYGFPGRQTIDYVERDIVEHGKSIINAEDSFTNHLGQKFYFLTTKIPLRNVENEIVGIIGIGKNITERKEMELRLEEQNREFEAVFNAIPDLFFKLDDQGIIRRFFAGTHSNLYKKPEEFIGQPVASTLPEHVAVQTISAIRNALVTNSLQQYEYQLELGGTLKYFESNIYPLNAREVIAVVRDITRRKTTEQARLTTDSRLKAIIASQTNYVIRTDLKGNYTYYNRKFDEDFGWIHESNANGFLGQNFMHSILPEHHARVNETVNRCFEKPNVVFKVEVDKPRKDGGVRTTLWDFICLADEKGNPTEIQCMGIDISDRKHAEEALAEERRNLDLILNNMSGGVLMLNREGELVFVNESAREILHNDFSRKAPLSEIFVESITTDRDGRAYSHDQMPLEQALAHGTIERNKLFHITWDNGVRRWISVSATPIRNAAGDITSAVSSFTDVTHEMEAEEKLRESEFRFKSLVEDAPVFILMGENNQFASYVNKSFREFLGIDQTELSIEEYLKRIHPDDFDASGHGTLSDFTNQVQLEYRLRNAQGEYRTLAFNIIPRADRQPGVRRYLATATDITAIRDAEKTMRDNNFILEELVAERTQELTSLNIQLLKEIKQRNSAELQREEVKRQLDVAFSQIESINTNINEAVYRSTADRLVYANRAMATMFGYDSVEEILAIPVSSLYPHPIERAEFLQKVLTEKRWQNYEHLMRRKDGSLFPVLLSGAATFDEAENLIHIDGTMRDITSLKATQEELAQKSHDLSQAQRLALLGYWTLNVQNDAPEWRSEFYSENGLEDIHPMPYGKIFNHRVSEEDIDRFAVAVSKALAEGEAQYEFKIDLNSEITRYIRGQIRRAEPVSPEYSCVLFGISRDVTKEKISELEMENAREQAENLAKAKQQFLANMSHEIRTPINGIRGMTHLLGQSKLDEEQTIFIQAIKTSSDTLLGIINDILDIAKIDAGKIVFEKATFSMKSVVQSVAQIVEIKSREKHLPLILHVEDQMPDMVSGDSLRLSQILTNLLDNAVKFTEKGHVQLKVELAGEQSDSWDVRFIVSDTGMGIPANRMQQIFELFEQSDSSITRKFGGTGLGLAIVKRLIEHQGGTLQVQSTVNRGSQFRFVLSFGKPKDFQYQKDSNRIKVQTLDMSHLCVLVTDDNAINRLWATKLLKNWGCKILEAANGIEALEQMHANSIDLILMDLYMPEMDGYEASRLIRSDLPYPKSSVPIIALTADVLDDQDKRVRDASIDAWLGKPFDPAELHQLILQLTVQARETEENTRRIEAIQKKSGSLNFARLEEMAEGDVDFIHKLVSEFRDLTKSVLVDLKTAIEVENLDDIRKLVHKTKPNLEYFGADEEFALADTILKAFKTQTITNLDAIREPVMNLLERLEDIFQILLESEL